MSTSTDVVVTGLGATTPLGGDVASTWDALLESGEAKSGDLALVLGYGAGLTFAGQVLVLP